jgi:hypothetical protein
VTVAATLSDQAWTSICAAARRTPDAEARAELSKILFDEYPGFSYHRERVAEAFKRSQRMLKQLDDFAELYRQSWLPKLPFDQFQAVLAGRAMVLTGDVKTEAHFYWLAQLRSRAEAEWLTARVMRAANARKANVQRAWLYHQLCSVWRDHFEGDLTYTVPPLGGPPHGQLIDFIVAAFRQVVSVDALPAAETVRDAIDREKRERENLRQLVLKLMGD